MGGKYCVSSTVFIAHQETQSQFLSGQCITQVQLKYFIFEIFIVNMINFRIEKKSYASCCPYKNYNTLCVKITFLLWQVFAARWVGKL